MVVLLQYVPATQRKADMSAASPTVPINPRTQEGLSLRVQRVADQVATYPDNHDLVVLFDNQPGDIVMKGGSA